MNFRLKLIPDYFFDFLARNTKAHWQEWQISYDCDLAPKRISGDSNALR